MKRALDFYKLDCKRVNELTDIDEDTKAVILKTLKEQLDQELDRFDIDVIILDSEPSKEQQQKRPRTASLELPPAIIEFRNFIYPNPDESVETFTARFKPSRTPQTVGNWIAVSSPTQPSSEGSLGLASEECEVILGSWSEKLQAIENDPNIPARASKKNPNSKKRVKEQHGKEIVAKLTSTAKAHDIVIGKWLIFAPPNEVDGIWKSVALATSKGLLGCSAKVATASIGQEFHVMCIYTNDFTDREDVARVLRELQKMFPDIKRWSYKCDLYTHLGIMSHNPWGLSPCIYNAKDFM